MRQGLQGRREDQSQGWGPVGGGREEEGWGGRQSVSGGEETPSQMAGNQLMPP